MPRRSNKFQRLVLLINACLGNGTRVAESALLRDKITGELREVDILITATTSGYDFTIAIEVVGRGRRVDVLWVENMYSKHLSLNTNKLVLVSENGFTKSAFNKAQFYNIDCITIQTALKTDWKLLTELTPTGSVAEISFKYFCYIVYKDQNGIRKQIKVGSDSYFTCGEKTTILSDFINHILRLPDTRNFFFSQLAQSDQRQFWFSYVEPGGPGFMQLNGTNVEVVELRVSLDVEYSNTAVKFSTGRYKNVPFFAASSEDAANDLNFVVLEKTDGTHEGLIVMNRTSRTLTPIAYDRSKLPQ